MRLRAQTIAVHKGEEIIWSCEHDPVYTTGRRGINNCLGGKLPAPFIKTDRGGETTFHGPGQLLFYPVINLRGRGLAVKQYVHILEQSCPWHHTTLAGRLLLYDAMDMKFREVKLRRDPACPACGEHPTIHKVVEYEQFCGLPPTEAKEEDVLTEEDITPAQLKQMLDKNPDLFVLDVREPHEIAICRIKGTREIPLGQIPRRLNRAHTRGMLRSAYV